MPVGTPAGAVATMIMPQPVADLAERPLLSPPSRIYRAYRDKDEGPYENVGDLAWGAAVTAFIDPRRRDYYRQNYFYGGTPYYGRQFYGAPAYYGGRYYAD